ncbi:uncharacterized protein LOC129716805 [Wyeomyia smithii]|uniref:uncharacterized protein LOC129716805 n=1 Tax=Wyeomyia smithii TaxID=174621 RepID=UPI002467D4CC|nr:uncharacterized protein LOC129716805 [Wyeomyia smithii]
MTFVGYSSESKAYRCLDIKTGQIVISRDVKFLETMNEGKEAGRNEGKKVGRNPDESGEIAVLTEVPVSSAEKQENEDSPDEFYSDSENEAIADENVRQSSRANFGVAPERLMIGI